MKPIFLGWNEPLLRLTARFLIDNYTINGRLDLKSVTLVLPGRRAINRLEELLAPGGQNDSKNYGWYPPEMITPGSLPEMFYEPLKPVASEMTQWYAWMESVRKLSESGENMLSPLLSVLPKTFNGRLALGRMLARLHYDLAEENVTFEEVAEACEELGLKGEQARWRVLSQLQDIYANDVLATNIVPDREIWDIQAARLYAIDRQPEDEQKRIRAKLDDRMIYLVGLVDMNKLQKGILEKYPKSFTPLVFAPKDDTEEAGKIRARFDEFGCLKAADWFDAPLEIEEDNIAVAWSPENQAEIVMDKIDSMDDQIEYGKIIVGVPDREVVPFLQKKLDADKIPVRFIEGSSIRQTPVFLFLRLLRKFMEKRLYADYAELVRHPDVENFIREHVKIKSKKKAGDTENQNAREYCPDFLTSLDEYHNKFFPKKIDGRWKGSANAYYEVLPMVWNALENTLGVPLSPEKLEKRELGKWLKIVDKIVRKLYADAKFVDATNPAALEIVKRTIGEMNAVVWPEKIEFDEVLELLLSQIESKPITPAEVPNAVELLGWLELAWDDAPVAIVTGMNEGIVPSFSVSDRFLPDKLRTKLKIMDNRRRGARDAYALNVLMETRKDEAARFLLIAGRRNAEGDALRPSRFFFMSKDAKKAAERVREYFKEAEPQASGRSKRHMPKPAEELVPWSHVPLPELPEPVGSLNVTDLSRYERCHYRFYLEKLRCFKKVDDDAVELKPNDFGILIHHILRRFGEDENIRDSRSADEIRRFLDRELDEYTVQVFGNRPPASLAIQIDRARSRLHDFADWQAERRSDGYKIIHAEFSPNETVTLAGVALKGQIDRIDCRETEDGREFVVIDYKTGNPNSINDILRQSTDWKDFQMPLYQYIFERSRDIASNDTFTLMYLMIPEEKGKLVPKPASWDKDVVQSAIDRAECIIRDGILARDWSTVTPEEIARDDFVYICASGLEQ